MESSQRLTSLILKIYNIAKSTWTPVHNMQFLNS